MSSFFNRPAPRQAVPGDLAGGRQDIIDALFGNPRGNDATNKRNTLQNAQDYANSGYRSKNRNGGHYGNRPTYENGGLNTNGTGGGPQNVLNQLLGLTGGATEASDIAALRTSSNQNLQDNINASNANSPGRFSTANAYQNSQLTERSNNDLNTMVAALQQKNRDRQLQAIMGLLGPVLGPTFGGPFTQGSSGFDNFLGLLNTASNFVPLAPGSKNAKVGG